MSYMVATETMLNLDKSEARTGFNFRCTCSSKQVLSFWFDHNFHYKFLIINRDSDSNIVIFLFYFFFKQNNFYIIMLQANKITNFFACIIVHKEKKTKYCTIID